MRSECGEIVPQLVLTHPASIGVPPDVRIVRTLEPRLLWADRYRIHIFRGHQTNLVTKLREFTRPIMGRGASFHADKARRQRFDECWMSMCTA